MPARKRTGGASPSTSANSSNADDMEYRLKRQRNNDAVKKTRAKSKETANERKRRVDELKKENEKLQGQIVEKKNNIQTLKDLLINNVKSEDQERMIQSILEEPSDDEDEAG